MKAGKTRAERLQRRRRQQAQAVGGEPQAKVAFTMRCANGKMFGWYTTLPRRGALSLKRQYEESSQQDQKDMDFFCRALIWTSLYESRFPVPETATKYLQQCFLKLAAWVLWMPYTDLAMQKKVQEVAGLKDIEVTFWIKQRIDEYSGAFDFNYQIKDDAAAIDLSKIGEGGSRRHLRTWHDEPISYGPKDDDTQ